MSTELAELKAKAHSAAGDRQWTSASMIHRKLAERLWHEQSRQAGLRHHFIDAIISIQGARDVGYLPSDRADETEFEPWSQSLGPNVVKRAGTYLQQYGPFAELREIYNEAVDQIWRDRFPVSREEVWAELDEKIKDIID